MMTKKQYDLYKVIKMYIEDYKRAPSIYELAIIMEKSPSSISSMLHNLKVRGYINKDASKRSIVITDKKVEVSEPRKTKLEKE